MKSKLSKTCCKVEAMNKTFFRAPLRFGFTLIELLVVVLIIGVLAAVALPQYNKAIEKSQAVQAQTLLKTLIDAQKAYYLQHGEYASTFDQLDVDIPNLGAPTKVIGDNFFNCGLSSSRIINQDWAVCLDSSHVYAGRLRGHYAGKAGFGSFSYPITEVVGGYHGGDLANYEQREVFPAWVFMCFDCSASSGYCKTDSYCNKLFNASTRIASRGPFEFFVMN